MVQSSHISLQEPTHTHGQHELHCVYMSMNINWKLVFTQHYTYSDFTNFCKALIHSIICSLGFSQADNSTQQADAS